MDWGNSTTFNRKKKKKSDLKFFWSITIVKMPKGSKKFH